MSDTPAPTRILIIDDNRSIHEDFEKILAWADEGSSLDALETAVFGAAASMRVGRPTYRLTSAFQGQQGLECVRQALAEGDPFAVAFVDVRMPPGWDGIETVNHLWQADPHLQIVICTAFSDYSWDEIRLRLRQIENFLILKKPFDIIEVRQLACSLTEKWLLARELRGRMSSLEQMVEDRTSRLRDALSIVSATLESTNDALLVVDSDGHVLVHNDHFKRMWNPPAEAMEAGGESLIAAIAGQVRSPRDDAERMRRLLQDRETIMRDLIETNDGRMLERYTQPFLMDGRPIGRVATYRDITERFVAEQARRRSDEQFRTIVDHAPDGVQILDPNGRLLQVNRSALATLEATALDVTGRDFMGYVVPEHREVFGELLRSALRGEHPELELEIVTTNGTRRWIDARAVRLDHSATMPAVLLMTRDQTERRHLAQQLQQAQKLEAIGRLAGGIAHDFNNLLTVINGQCQLLLAQTPEESRTATSLREILKAGRRAAALTSQLLSFSRRQVLSPKIVDLNALIRETDKMLRRLIGEDIQYDFLEDPALWPVRVDPHQMMQVLMNLVVNARDAMPGGGRITVSTRNFPSDFTCAVPCLDGQPDTDFVRLSVTDTGTGIEPEILERIFEPFFTTKEQGKGTGLGLAMIHGFVRQSGGAIDVKSTPGVGSTFIIYLPRCDESATHDGGGAHHETARRREGLQAGGNELILLVEDENAVRRLASEFLRRAGYRVLEAGDVAHAESLFHEHAEIDLMITDVVMPGRSGAELASRFCSERPNLRVFYISGYPDEYLETYNVDRSTTPVLAKPFSPEQLISTVREMLSKESVSV